MGEYSNQQGGSLSLSLTHSYTLTSKHTLYLNSTVQNRQREATDKGKPPKKKKAVGDEGKILKRKKADQERSPSLLHFLIFNCLFLYNNLDIHEKNSNMPGISDSVTNNCTMMAQKSSCVQMHTQYPTNTKQITLYS